MADERTPAYEVAAATPDPEIPTLTIEDLGILRQVDVRPGDGGARELPSGAPSSQPFPASEEVVVTITPTYSGCPAMHEISADIESRLARAGFAAVTIKIQLSPPWTTDWITPEGKRKLSAVGIAPPPQARAPQARAPQARVPQARAGQASASAAQRRSGPVPLTLGLRPPAPACPRCGSPDTSLTAQFSATACKSLHRCRACGEPFEAVKAI